jgi:hypothetical protein
MTGWTVIVDVAERLSELHLVEPYLTFTIL